MPYNHRLKIAEIIFFIDMSTLLCIVDQIGGIRICTYWGLQKGCEDETDIRLETIVICTQRNVINVHPCQKVYILTPQLY